MWILTHSTILVNTKYIREIGISDNFIYYHPYDDNCRYDLGIYNNETETNIAYAQLCQAFTAGDVLFKMPFKPTKGCDEDAKEQKD